MYISDLLQRIDIQAKLTTIKKGFVELKNQLFPNLRLQFYIYHIYRVYQKKQPLVPLLVGLKVFFFW